MQDQIKEAKPYKWKSFTSWRTWVTLVCRLGIGFVFAFSGFVKAIDPWGTVYKMTEYLQAMGLEWEHSLVVVAVFALFTVEFMIGIFALTGSFRRLTPIATLLFMVVMLPLTLWIAVANPVADCGCFGDAWVISNWATFWKNVVLTAMAVWLLLYNRRTQWLITPTLQWIEFVLTAAFAIVIGYYGYSRQPMIDFRPYKVGAPLFSEEETESDEHFVFIYEKDGVKREFSETDELPDEEDGWTFIDRKEVETEAKGQKDASRHSLRVYDEDGEEDLTPELAANKEGATALLLMPDLAKVSIANSWTINSLYEWTQAHGVGMAAVVSGSPDEVAEWKDFSMAEYPVYTADDTDIKEVARGNPAIVWLENGQIKWKSTIDALQTSDFMETDSLPTSLVDNNLGRRLLNRLTVFYVCLLAVLSMLSFVQKVALFRPKLRGLRVLRRGGKARREE